MKDIVVFDWDGVLIDSMPLLTKLGRDCVQKYFNIDITMEKAKEHAFNLGGIPFLKLLEIALPKSNKEVRKKCANEFQKRKIQEVYKKAKSFPDTNETLRKLRNKKIPIVISSSFEKWLISKWIRANILGDVFSMVFGIENGSKKEHIRTIMSIFDLCEQSGTKIIYISDSPGDMQLGNINIGIGCSKDEREKLKKAGADFTASSIKTIPKIYQKIQTMPVRK